MKKLLKKWYETRIRQLNWNYKIRANRFKKVLDYNSKEFAKLDDFYDMVENNRTRHQLWDEFGAMFNRYSDKALELNHKLEAVGA